MKGILVDGIEIPEGVSDGMTTLLFLRFKFLSECVNLILSMLRVNEQDRIPISKYSLSLESTSYPAESVTIPGSWKATTNLHPLISHLSLPLLRFATCS